MNDTLTFSILGEPVAKGRPKITTFKGFARAYTPIKTRNAEADVRSQIIAQLPKGHKPFTYPVSIKLTIMRAKPKSASKKVTEPITRPDLDNYIKLYLDAMNTIVFSDDALIVDITARKKFAVCGAGAHIEVTEVRI